MFIFSKSTKTIEFDNIDLNHGWVSILSPVVDNFCHMLRETTGHQGVNYVSYIL